MRWLGWMIPALAALAAVIMGPGSVAAAATYPDSISGYEYAATSTQGRFAGAAPGALPGAWSATVDHTPLGTAAMITGGDVYLATYLDGVPALVTGHFTGGTASAGWKLPQRPLLARDHLPPPAPPSATRQRPRRADGMTGRQDGA
jgi:hypothetical protein